ncbi:MbcA/ParS/Xre antitoxin family protein [Kiloniella litopenaei]|uniref:MbcA/ParS/Xre antitoxin family protein n=1 Tax=Kiloniella litopenaei TaxID=1549748 RepID=UPI0019505905
MFRVHRALRIIFKEPGRGYEWIVSPNASFGGETALEIMETDIGRVKAYLEAEADG